MSYDLRLMRRRPNETDPMLIERLRKEEEEPPESVAPEAARKEAPA
jgi:hypothetical protein